MQGGNTVEIKKITSREKAGEFLFKDPYQHLYEIGNLHEKFFGRSEWFCAGENSEIKAMAMVHKAEDEKNNMVFLLENKNMEHAAGLLQGIKDILPAVFYAHVTKETAELLKPKYEISTPVIYNKMRINGDMFVGSSIKYPEYTYRVNANDFETVNEFLRAINPSAFFMHSMLKTGKYFIIRKNSDIIAMAGVHFYSKETGIAAIGNVATAPEFRGKGYAGSVTASLVQDLWKEVKYIGLNVRADNTAAIKVYEKMGFVFHSSHEEILAKRVL